MTIHVRVCIMKISQNSFASKLTAAAVVAALLGFGATRMRAPHENPSEMTSVSRRGALYTPSASEWASLAVEPVSEQVFRAEQVTEGKIAINEDSSTPIFSPYAGRVVQLLVKPGDVVTRGQPLFIVEATDTVQGLNDFITALGAVNKARSTLGLAEIVEKRANDLYAGKAVPLKDWQQAQADLTTAQNDMGSAETALEAAHNRLRILGRSEEQIAAFQQTRQMSADTPIDSPIGGTVVQRKIGPGQFIASGASDPAFVIGDLSTVWLTAFVRETEASGVAVGQEIAFSLLALPGRHLSARIDYVAPALDPATRRLLVRATIDNKDGALKPEMFADVTIYSGKDHPTVGVPKQALIYEGDHVRLWVAHRDKSIELREVRTGLANGDLVEVVANLRSGENVVTRGSLFIDRAASGS
jgi:membrane fusion protein, heavy metal efflux system